MPSSTPEQPQRATGKWYFIVTVASCGLLAAVPFFHAATILGKPSLRKVGAVYAGTALVSFTLIGVAPVDAHGSPTGWLANLGAVVALTVIVGATLQQIGLRHEVYGQARASSTRSENLTAIELVEQARAKRREARDLARRDPQMARELRIGRPDLPRHYDDGGLVDLNAADPDAIANVCQIPRHAADQLAAIREQIGGFSSVEEAVVHAALSSAPGLRDRGIVVAPSADD